MEPSSSKKTFIELLHGIKNRHRVLTVSVCLAMVVVIGIVAMLMTPGNAMTLQALALDCQYTVHHHTSSCYDEENGLICGQADYVVHLHGENCYDESGELVCTIPERAPHTHTEACYATWQELVCGLEEELGHTHSEGCYLEDGEPVLTCDTAEHTHSDECYTQAERIDSELNCIETEHAHTEACYDTNEDGDTVLVCTEAEHTHSEECYTQTEQVDLELICVETEHTHSDDCYTLVFDEDAEPVCGKEEQPTGHVHTGECYKTVKGLVCGELELHTHDDSCYETIAADATGEDGAARQLICTELTLEEHVHDISCFRTIEKTADELDDETTKLNGVVPDEEEEEGEENEEPSLPLFGDPIVLTDDDVDFGLSYFNKSTGMWEQIPEGTDLAKYLGSKIRVDVFVKEHVDLTKENLQAHGYQISYELPKYFDLISSTGGKIQAGSREVGDIYCDSATNTALLVFNPDYVDEKTELINLKFNVQGWFDWDEINKDGTDREIFKKNPLDMSQTDEDFFAEQSSLDLEKKVTGPLIVEADGEYYVEYTLTVTAGHHGAPDVTVTDNVFKGNDYWQPRWFTKDGDVYPLEFISETSSVDGFRPGSVSSVNGGKYVDGVWVDHALEWNIGDMEPDEVRTLTYRVHLDRDYVDKSTSDGMPNTADVKAKDEIKDTAVENVNLWASAELYKDSSGFEFNRDENGAVIDGSGTITYTVYLHAFDHNDHALDLVLTDSLAKYLDYADNRSDYTEIELTAPDLLPWLHFSEVAIYEGNLRYASAEELAAAKPFDTSRLTRSGPVSGGDALEVLIEDMAPGEELTIVYTIHVDPEAFELYNGDFQILNGVNVNTQQIPDSDGITGRYVDSAWTEDNVEGKTWVEKLKGRKQSKDGEVKLDPADAVYDYHNGLTEVTSYPEKYSYAEGDYLYTVIVNKGGIWDITSRAMTDELTDKQHMAYVGYVKVTGTLEHEDGTTEVRTVWVNVDGLTEFTFTGDDLGFSADAWVLELEYYTTPINLDGMVNVTFGNRFGLGPVPGHNLPEIEVTVNQTLTGTLDFTGAKYAWYYDPVKQTGPGWTEHGALYWVLQVTASEIPDNMTLRDRANSSNHKLRQDSIVGAYFGDPGHIFKTEFENYAAFEDALPGLGFEALESGTDYVEDQQGSTNFYIHFPQTLTIPEGKVLYFIVKTDPNFLPTTETGTVTYNNSFRRMQTTDGVDGNWFTEGDDTIVLGEPDGVQKSVGQVFGLTRNDEGKIVIDPLYAGEYDTVIEHIHADGRDDVELDSGLYVTWLVKANLFGDLEGTYELVDTLPDGLELASVAVVDIKHYDASSKYMPHPVSVDETGWTAHRSPTTYKNSQYENHWREWYYYTQDNQVKWRVDWPKPANSSSKKNSETAYTVSFLVTCRITDEDILLGSEDPGVTSKRFDNTVDIFRLVDGKKDPCGSSQAYVDIDCQVRLTKELLNTGSEDGLAGMLDFEIKVNEYGEDLTLGSKITIVDKMSPNLMLDLNSVRVLDADRNPVDPSLYDIDIKVNIDTGTIMKITLPDDQIFYVTYRAQVNAPANTPTAISNYVSFEGRNIPDKGSYVDGDFKYAAGGTVEATQVDIEIRKISQEGSEALPGAEFTLTKVILKDGEFVTAEGDEAFSATAVTDENGELRFSPVSLSTIYRLEETKAPYGYMADYLNYFIVVKTAEEAESYADCEGLQIIYYTGSETIPFLIPNPRCGIIVTKQFADNNGGPVMPLEGTYRFGLYTKDSEGNLIAVEKDGVPYIQEIVVSEGSTVSDYTFRFEDLSPDVTYYVYELGAGDVPILQSGTMYRYNMVYSVSYDYGTGSNDGISLDPDSPGNTVTVTNTQIEQFELPETGGIGITPLFILGGLLTIGAGMLLTVKRHPKKQS